jgi:hypothetical protein
MPINPQSASGAGGVSDAKDTYEEIAVQTGTTYTVIDEGSVMVPVDTTSNAITITPNASPVLGDRLRVYDKGGNCGTLIATITGCGTIQTDNGAMEWRWDGSVWVQIDAVREIITRNAATNEVTALEPDTLIANKFKTPAGGDGLEILNATDEIVAQIDNTGKITAKSGEFGQSASDTERTVTAGDFTNLGFNVNVGVADEYSNSLITSGTQFNDGNLNTDDSTPYVTSASSVSGAYSPYKAFDGLLTSGTGSSHGWLSGAGTTGWLKIDLVSPRTFVSYQMGGAEVNRGPRDYTIEGSNNDSDWDVVHTVTDQDHIQAPNISGVINMDSPASYRYYRVNVTSVNGGASVSIAEMRYFESIPATTLNTFDSLLALGAGSFDPSSFVATDENDLPINGAGKIQLAYSVDGGAFQGEIVDAPTVRPTTDLTTAVNTVLVKLSDLGLSGNVTISEISIECSTGTESVEYYTATPNASNFDLTSVGTESSVAFVEDTPHAFAISDTVLNADTDYIGASLVGNSVDFKYANGGYDIQFVAGSLTGNQTNQAMAGANFTYNFGVKYQQAYDQESFKALDTIAYSSQFNLRTQLVGSQRFSKLALSTPAGNTMQVNTNGDVIATSGTFGLAGAVSDQSVADSDYTNVGANVDVTVADEYGNELLLGDVSSSVDYTLGVNFIDNGGVAITSFHTVDGFMSQDAPARYAIYGGDFIFDLGASHDIYGAYLGDDPVTGGQSNFFPADTKLQVGPSISGPWTDVLSAFSGFDGSTNGEVALTVLPTVTSGRYWRVDSSNGLNHFGSFALVTLNHVSMNNTFDTNLATGESGTFSPSSFKAYDELSALISGTGKVNVAYAVDGEGFIGDTTMILLHLDGVDGSTTLTDSVGGFTVTPAGAAEIDTAQSKFGGASLELDASADGAYITHSTDLDLTTQDFTFDCWVRPVDLISTKALYSNTSGSFSMDIQIIAGTIRLRMSDDGASAGTVLTTGTEITAGVWQHVAVVRNGLEVDIYVDGVSVGNVTLAGGFSLFENTNDIRIGVGGEIGHLDEWRLMIGVAEWTTDFTPPTAAHSANAFVDQETFKALGDVAYTTQFDLQLQLVGSQRFSKATLATPDNTMEIQSDGKVIFKESGAPFAQIGPNGIQPPSLTTAERDAVVSPADGLLLFNETTNKLNFYNGSAWEAVTSS